MEIIPSYNVILSQLANSTIEQKVPEYFAESIGKYYYHCFSPLKYISKKILNLFLKMNRK